MTLSPGMTAADIVAGVHNGAFSSADVVDVHLSQIERYDRDIQAFVTVEQDLVLTEAAWSDAQRRSGARLPLHGVPVGVKDIIDVAGMPTVAGFEPFRQNIAERDAEIVSRLRTLGAVIMGKTHTTQFAVGDPAPTRNPWNLEKSPAGSSAGSGAAVPSGMVPIALGSQTAGSMLRPAAFNGAVGYKPSYGWMSLDGVIPLCWSLDHLGIYAATVEDISLVFRGLTGRYQAPAPALPPAPRIALLTEYLDLSDPPVAAHVRDVASQLNREGCAVVETNLPVSFDDLHAVHQVIFAAEMSAVHSASLGRYTEHYGPRIRTGVEAGSLIPATYLLHAKRLQQRLSASVSAFLTSFDALLLPTVSTEACDRAETGDRRFQIPATLLGLPAISLPTGLSPNRLPLGTQLIGHAGHDQELLALSSRVTESYSLIGRPF